MHRVLWHSHKIGKCEAVFAAASLPTIYPALRPFCCLAPCAPALLESGALSSQAHCRTSFCAQMSAHHARRPDARAKASRTDARFSPRRSVSDPAEALCVGSANGAGQATAGWGTAEAPLSAYLHLPFCKKKCLYCEGLRPRPSAQHHAALPCTDLTDRAPPHYMTSGTGDAKGIGTSTQHPDSAVLRHARPPATAWLRRRRLPSGCGGVAAAAAGGAPPAAGLRGSLDYRPAGCGSVPRPAPPLQSELRRGSVQWWYQGARRNNCRVPPRLAKGEKRILGDLRT